MVLHFAASVGPDSMSQRRAMASGYRSISRHFSTWPMRVAQSIGPLAIAVARSGPFDCPVQAAIGSVVGRAMNTLRPLMSLAPAPSSAPVSPSAPCKPSLAETRGWEVSVQPAFVPERSDPMARTWVFSYKIKITNKSEAPARLISRHWVIVSAHGQSDEVRGDGVVGSQPRLEPGESFTYQSFCPLPTSWGTMEGTYSMRTDDGEHFDVAVGRFYLVGPRG